MMDSVCLCVNSTTFLAIKLKQVVQITLFEYFPFIYRRSTFHIRKSKICANFLTNHYIVLTICTVLHKLYCFTNKCCDATLVLLNCLYLFFIHPKLELLSQLSSSNDEKEQLTNRVCWDTFYGLFEFTLYAALNIHCKITYYA